MYKDTVKFVLKECEIALNSIDENSTKEFITALKKKATS